MVNVNRRKGNPIILLIIGIVIIIMGLIFCNLMYKEDVLICNSSDKYKGVCVLFEKGLTGETSKRFSARQIKEIRTEEHKDRDTNTSRGKRGKTTYSYSYSIHIKLADGTEIQYPPNSTVGSQLRDEILIHLTALKDSGGTMPVCLNQDSRFLAILLTGMFVIIGIVFILSAFFR